MIKALNEFPEIFENQFGDSKVGKLLAVDYDYLWSAYLAIEQYWYSEFERLDNIKVILLSEAPLYGDKKSYFYNPEVGATAFFGYAHFRTIFGEKNLLAFSSGEAVRSKKLKLFDAMRREGILILDLFPFAL